MKNYLKESMFWMTLTGFTALPILKLGKCPLGITLAILAVIFLVISGILIVKEDKVAIKDIRR